MVKYDNFEENFDGKENEKVTISRKRRRKHIPHSQRSDEYVIKRNGRERERARAVNNAFDVLRRRISMSNNEIYKPSKVEILKNATSYIQNLCRLLTSGEQQWMRNPGSMGKFINLNSNQSFQQHHTSINNNSNHGVSLTAQNNRHVLIDENTPIYGQSSYHSQPLTYQCNMPVAINDATLSTEQQSSNHRTPLTNQCDMPVAINDVTLSTEQQTSNHRTPLTNLSNLPVKTSVVNLSTVEHTGLYDNVWQKESHQALYVNHEQFHNSIQNNNNEFRSDIFSSEISHHYRPSCMYENINLQVPFN